MRLALPLTGLPLAALLRTFSWQELRQHPWRSAAAVVAVTLGVALAFSVHLINASALEAFSQALHSVDGQPDLELRAAQGTFDEIWFERVARDPQTEALSPVLEWNTLQFERDGGPGQPIRVLGVDGLRVADLSPGLLPRSDVQADRLAMLLPDRIFLNPAAQLATHGARRIRWQTPAGLQSLVVAGRVSAGGPPLAVMDIAAAQDLFGQVGRLSRLDLRLRPGADRHAYLERLDLPGHLVASAPDDANQRNDGLSRAYRVNLTVLALVALFTGAFLVYSVLALSVARRSRQFALLGVLGLTPGGRAMLVLSESLLLGGLGSALGLALGTGLAALALRLLGGDLGGGYFSGSQPPLQWSPLAALLFGGLGVVAALLGGWWPARAAQALPPAQALKGLSLSSGPGPQIWIGLALMVGAAALALVPPVAGMPLGAYLSVALLLLGGIAVLPGLITPIYLPLARRLRHRWLPLLAVERARRMSGSATAAIGGVVASLSLAVALTVMVASFRDSVSRWLDQLLPAPLYVRLAGGLQAGDVATLPPTLVKQLASLPDVGRVAGLRVRSLLLDPSLAPVSLIARPLEPGAGNLPLVQGPYPTPADHIGVYISEAMVDLYHLKPGHDFPSLSRVFEPEGATSAKQGPSFYIAGVWRDYARQSGSIVMQHEDYRRLTADPQINDLAVWPATGVEQARLEQAILALARAPGAAEAAANLELASSADIRARSLHIFDRSFAVTYWLQAVAIAIGLFGVAASFSAQVLARRKEFGLLAHLGLSRRQILTLVAAEGAVWTLVGAVAGLLLGLAVSVLLVKVVNPQSFHWTMDLLLPGWRLAALCGSTVAAGTLTAWLAGRAAAQADAVLAVREDW